MGMGSNDREEDITFFFDEFYDLGLEYCTVNETGNAFIGVRGLIGFIQFGRK